MKLRLYGFVLGLGVLVFLHPEAAWAKKPEQVTIRAEPVKVTVVVSGDRKIIQGSRQARLTVDRKQPNGCTKVRYLRVVRGNDPDSLDELAFRRLGS
ncbi:MAG: hypothetical protein Q9M29_09870, partial [Mariprofundaceae bacterium]|nr:hypothetical protein [Mariprofundaceae bacterium]